MDLHKQWIEALDANMNSIAQ
jgi:hypothetical protein